MELFVISTGQPAALVNETTSTVAVRPMANDGMVSVFVPGSNEGKIPPRQINNCCPLTISRSLIANGGKIEAVTSRSASKGRSLPVTKNIISFGSSGQFPSQTIPPPDNDISGQLTGKLK